MKINLGIAPINWSNDDDPRLGQDISFEQCIDEMSVAGYVGTELGHKYPRDVSVLKRALSDRGLQLSSAWFSTYFTEPEKGDATLSRFLDHISFMKALGSRFINVCECGHAIQGTELPVLGDQKPVFTDLQWDLLVKGIHALGRIAHDYDMQLVYHYHAGTGVFTASEIDRLMKSTSPGLLSLLLDTGHAALAGISSVDLVKNYGNRIKYVHLKDIRDAVAQKTKNENLCFMDAVRDGVFTVPGDGIIPFPAIFKALAEIHYEGWMIVEAEQDPAKAPPLDYAKKAHAYIQSLKAMNTMQLEETALI